MKCTVEIGSDAVIYIPSFIRTGSAIQKLIRRRNHIKTHKQQGDLISLPLFFQNKENRLKIT
jgi:hypothetical protein